MPVQAEEHVVIILETGFFPQKTVLEHSDIVRFANESGRETAVFHAKGNWATSPIASGEELLVMIKPGMTGAFYGNTTQRIVGRLDLAGSEAAD